MQSKIQSIALKNLRSILIERGISAEALFTKYDIDGDGFISKSEFSTAISSITGQIAPAAIIDGVFSVLDRDSSGLLDFHELISLVDSEGKSSFDDGENILVSEHPLSNYNGIYTIQNNEINGKPWFKNDGGSILYFYNANSGGSPSWSLDDRLQDGSNDWYRGGWTRPPNSGGPPLGSRRWVGAGKVTMESISKSGDENKTNQSENQLTTLLSEIDLAVDHFEKRVVEGTLPPEKATELANSAFENKVQELPFVLQSPARSAWNKKMKNFESKIDSLFDGAGVGVAGLGAAAVAGATISQQTTEPINSYTEKIRDSGLNSSKDLGTEDNQKTSKLESTEQATTNFEKEENQEVQEKIPKSSKLEDSNNENQDSSEMEKSNSDVNNNELLSVAYNDFINCKMLSERNSIKEKYMSQSTQIKIEIISIERTFGIGISEIYRGGKTLIASSEGLEDFEIRLPQSYDVESLKPRSELDVTVTFADWNSVRKRLILNYQ